MRRLFGILAVTLLVTACTPEQVARFMHKSVKDVTPEEVSQATTLAKQAKVHTRKEFAAVALKIHNDPFLVCTRGHESDTAGGYQAYNPAGPAYGAYQFLRGTWNSVALHLGMPQYVGVDITQVPGFIQDIFAMDLYHWQGKAPWEYLC